ncbi:MAG TPA: 3D domain-containing protein [Actinomycetes bacterium]
MPSRARHGYQLRAPTVALLGAVAGGLLLAACTDVNRPRASPPGTTPPTHSPAPPSTASGGRGADLGVFEVSCYTGKGVTALGNPSSRQTVSVDPRVVPLGTRLMIDKVGTRVAADTGMTGRRLDIWEPSAAACARFGRRQLRVWQGL